MKHTKIVRCIHFSQLNNMHTSQHQYIHYRKPSLKIGPHSPEATQGVETTLHMWQSSQAESERAVASTDHHPATDLDSTDKADMPRELKIAQPVSS